MSHMGEMVDLEEIPCPKKRICFLMEKGKSPMSQKRRSDLFPKMNKLMVIDEEDPYLQSAATSLVNRGNPGPKINGKYNNCFSLANE